MTHTAYTAGISGSPSPELRYPDPRHAWYVGYCEIPRFFDVDLRILRMLSWPGFIRKIKLLFEVTDLLQATRETVKSREANRLTQAWSGGVSWLQHLRFPEPSLIF